MLIGLKLSKKKILEDTVLYVVEEVNPTSHEKVILQHAPVYTDSARYTFKKILWYTSGRFIPLRFMFWFCSDAPCAIEPRIFS